jgi:hypothetical protein
LRAKSRATSATIARSGKLGLLSPIPTLADALSPRCSLTVIASTPHFRFCLRCARTLLPPRKKCVVDKCHKSCIFYARRRMRKRVFSKCDKCHNFCSLIN